MPNRGPINPYLAGPPITGKYGFFGRQSLIEAVTNAFTATRQNALVLHGQRRIGKSSLLHRLQRDETLQQAHIPIFFDMQLYEGFSPARILLSLAQKITETLHLDISPPAEAELTANFNLFERDFLPQIYPHLHDKRILILFDEFDVAVPSDITGPASADTLLGYLRPLIAGEQAHLAFIFVVGQRLDLLGEGYRRLFKGAQAHPVGRLKMNDTYALITELGKAGDLEYTEESRAEIWALTNGHPYLTQLIGSEIFDRFQRETDRTVLAEHVSACLDSAMEHGQGALDWFWRGFDAEQQWVLSAVADLTDRNRSITDSEIEASLKEHLLILTPLARDKAYRQLLQGDFLIKSSGTGEMGYQFAVEFIRHWIIRNHPIKEAKRQIEEMSPEALNYYQLGLHAYQRGDLNAAIKHYRLSIEHNQHFFDPQFALASALRAQGNIPEAITEYEQAYQLNHTGAKEELIDLRMTHARQLEQDSAESEALEQAWRILQLDSEHLQARALISRLYLAKIENLLNQNDQTLALELVSELHQPVPILSDEGVGERVRELWLAYSLTLVEQNPPNFTVAQHTLENLLPFNLFDEAVTVAFNQITLNKAQTLLNSADLSGALNILTAELKAPLPQEAIKAQLLSYCQLQIDNAQWPLAHSALTVLCELVDDADTQSARQNLYHQWGDALLEEQRFLQAIDVYQLGQTKEFKSKITAAWLQQAHCYQIEGELGEAEAAYQRALDIQNNKTIRQEIRQNLQAYFSACRAKQDWPQAEDALRILIDLNLAGDDGPLWQVDLQLDRARNELLQGEIGPAFVRLEGLGENAQSQIKELAREYAQQMAQAENWPAGASALKQLHRLFPADTEAVNWRVENLYNWAVTLFASNTNKSNPARAKVLCQKILSLIPPNLKTKTSELPAQTCALSANISITQAQSCLDENQLFEARDRFQEALNLPHLPADIRQDIQSRLHTYSRHQILKERWEQAQLALQVVLELGLGDSEIDQALNTLPANQARLLLKADRPLDAFEVLKRQALQNNQPPQENIQAMVYQFSRLYAGRNNWDLARTALRALYRWLNAEEPQIAHWLDALNAENLAFVQGRRESPPIPDLEMARMTEAFSAAQVGYEDAQNLNLPSETEWAEKFISAGLLLGQAHLANNNLLSAAAVYEKTLNINTQTDSHKYQISQNIHNYSEKMLNQNNWDEALKALACLQQFNLPAPDGLTRPDPRIDGAVQRVRLTHAETQLKSDALEQAFANLQALPRPRPEGEVKRIISAYSRVRQDQKEWNNAITALRRLDRFLADDRQQPRDQEALQWLVDGLQAWGSHLEAEPNLEQAAEIYLEALELTRLAARPKNDILAECYIKAALQLAQQALDTDPLNGADSAAVNLALEWYQKCLAIPERRPQQERQISKALYKHAQKLIAARQWERAYAVLDHLDSLFPQAKLTERTAFAIWRRHLALEETQTHLAGQNLDPAFARLSWLKDWLVNKDIPKASWADTQEGVKNLVYKNHSLIWLAEQKWELAGQALFALAQLIPNDNEITGWQVDALCQWGLWLQKEGQLTQALSQFEAGIELAPRQNLIPMAQIEGYYLDTQLALAQESLQTQKLEQAINVYKQALQHPPEYLNRADKIRQALKAYADSLTKQSQPDWQTAHNALDYLYELHLDNEEVSQWRQILALQEMQAHLKEDNVPAAFASLKPLKSSWPLEEIQSILRQYKQERAHIETWPLAVQALQTLGETLKQDTLARQWVVQELTELGDALEAQNNLQGAQTAFEVAINFS